MLINQHFLKLKNTLSKRCLTINFLLSLVKKKKKKTFCHGDHAGVIKKRGVGRGGERERGGRNVYLPTKKRTCVMVFEDVKHYVRAHEKDRG